jgi:hypothetical protein
MKFGHPAAAGDPVFGIFYSKMARLNNLQGMFKYLLSLSCFPLLLFLPLPAKAKPLVDTTLVIPVVTVNYPSGAWELSASHREVLELYIFQNQVIYRDSTVLIYLEGHADNTGSAASNLLLSKKRVSEVAALFMEKGIPAARMNVSYYGSERPGKQKPRDSKKRSNILHANRRVIIRIVKP